MEKERNVEDSEEKTKEREGVIGIDRWGRRRRRRGNASESRWDDRELMGFIGAGLINSTAKLTLILTPTR